ncbi:MAG: cytochrome c [Acidobacteriota bacterium]|nr:cytochrome c [Acidobacteriota bacterium]
MHAITLRYASSARAHGCAHAAGAFGLSLALCACAFAQGTTYSTIERGRYLVDARDCASCHTAEGGQPFAGGKAIATPFGTIYSTNITPDASTGIGKWSDQDLFKAMHDGIRRDGKHLYPAFPYPWFTRTSRDDVRAIRAFLNTLAPVRQQNKPSALPWPLDIREVMAGWNTLYFHEGFYKPNPDKSGQWNRGAYLVEGLGHCGACHTGTNVLGGTKTDEKLRGGDFGEHWYAPTLTGNLREGLGAWSLEDIVTYLKTGSNSRSSAAGPMAEVVKNSTQHLSEGDLYSIAVYLKDVPADQARADTKASAVDTQALSHGEAVFVDNCTGCHMENGAGIPQIFPTLKGSSIVQSKNPDTVIHVVVAGAKTPGTSGKPTRFAMPAFDSKLRRLRTT